MHEHNNGTVGSRSITAVSRRMWGVASRRGEGERIGTTSSNNDEDYCFDLFPVS